VIANKRLQPTYALQLQPIAYNCIVWSLSWTKIEILGNRQRVILQS